MQSLREGKGHNLEEKVTYIVLRMPVDSETVESAVVFEPRI